jgi:hypothetical protein
MGINSLQDYELKFYNRVSVKIIRYFLKRFGTDVLVRRSKVKDQHSLENPDDTEYLAEVATKVYGDYSGLSPAAANPDDTDTSVNVQFEARVLINTFPESPYDAAMSGRLEKQIVYTFDPILTNDRFEFADATGKRHILIVGIPIEVGVTGPAYYKYEVNSIGGDW